jgi:hypothetical protein
VYESVSTIFVLDRSLTGPSETTVSVVIRSHGTALPLMDERATVQLYKQQPSAGPSSDGLFGGC